MITLQREYQKYQDTDIFGNVKRGGGGEPVKTKPPNAAQIPSFRNNNATINNNNFKKDEISSETPNSESQLNTSKYNWKKKTKTKKTNMSVKLFFLQKKKTKSQLHKIKKKRSDNNHKQ